MTARIRGSDVYVVEDLRRILSALASASRRFDGQYGAGYGAALLDVSIAIGGNVMPQIEELVHEVIEYRAERTVERYQAPAERQFKIVGQREAPAQLARQAPEDMTGDDANVTLLSPRRGELRTRAGGYVWAGHDGYTAFWDAADWQRVTVEEARAWGELIPDDYAVLVRHRYADSKRRQLGQSVRVLPTERRMLR